MKEIESKISIISKAIDDKGGTDIESIDISKMTTIADYFVIASGNSSTQVKAIVDEIENKMFLAGYEEIYNKEGYNSGRWILLDLGDVIAHIFHKEEREFYNLERLWTVERKTKEE